MTTENISKPVSIAMLRFVKDQETNAICGRYAMDEINYGTFYTGEKIPHYRTSVIVVITRRLLIGRLRSIRVWQNIMIPDYFFDSQPVIEYSSPTGEDRAF